MFTSCCPSWILYVEKYCPEFIPNLSSCKSPQQMLAPLMKTYYAAKGKNKSGADCFGFDYALHFEKIRSPKRGNKWQAIIRMLILCSRFGSWRRLLRKKKN